MKPEFIVDAVRLKPAEQIGLHSQNDWEVSLVVKGSGTKTIGDTKSRFADGDLVVVPPGIPHCWNFDDDSTDNEGNIANITVKFNDSFLYSCAKTFGPVAENISRLIEQQAAFTPDTVRKEKIIAVMQRLQHIDRIGQSLAMFELITLLTSAGENLPQGSALKRNKSDERLDRIRIYTSCNMTHNITIADIAHHVGMNRSAFCYFFKKSTGQSYISYLNRMRIAKACSLLQSGTSAVSDIAYECGFNSIPYFNRMFRHLTGTSPNRYRAIKKQLEATDYNTLN